MKKLPLLLLSVCITFASVAQQRTTASVPGGPSGGNVSSSEREQYKARAYGAANKTTAGGVRWYNYARDYVDTIEQVLSGGATYVIGRTVPMWQDTNMIIQCASAAWHVNLVSVADIFAPEAPAFNDSTYFEGLLTVADTSSYIIDSIVICGKYRFNPAKTAVVDTLRLSFVQGNGGAESSDDIFGGTTTTTSHYGTITFHDLHYDSIKNYARHTMAWGTPSDNVKDIILTSANWGDTLSDGTMLLQIALPLPLSVSGHGCAGVSLSFVSGDPAIPTGVSFDTLTRSDGSYKFNVFEPMIDFVYDGTWPQWAMLPPLNDHNAGYFKQLPASAGGWAGKYTPQFEFTPSFGEGHYVYQYPDIYWRVSCTGCKLMPPATDVAKVPLIIKADTYPNPAADILHIPFRLSQNSAVEISLTNIVGQVVASRYMGNVASGTAVINTSAIPDGLYICTITAGTEHSVSKIAVTH